MESENNILPEEQIPEEEIPLKSVWQIQKEGWYDKLPLTKRHLDIIIVVGLVLLVLTFVVIALDAMDIFNPFGY